MGNPQVSALIQEVLEAGEKATPKRWVPFFGDRIAAVMCARSGKEVVFWTGFDQSYTADTPSKRHRLAAYIALANPANVLTICRSHQELERENERLREENADLKSSVVAFAAPWAARYGVEHMGLPDGHLHPEHYDLLERCGARMDSFTRAALQQQAQHEGEA